MHAVILAGGLGTRLAEETEVRPKPMVEVGGRPILWHIMKHLAHYDLQSFFIALGYKGDMIKRYFLDYYAVSSDLTLSLKSGKVTVFDGMSEDWAVHLVDTGQSSNTGGRIRRLQSKLQDDTFVVTYGDGVCDVNVRDLLAFHRRQGCIATVTAVRPPARYGRIVLDGDRVGEFTEKPQAGEGWINGGFLVFEPEVFRYLSGDDTSLEMDALERLAADGQLAAYRHHGFWQCMDTLRDKRRLEAYWEAGDSPWKVW
ncbi:MAG TPA: glucose-1-phosphate cytidylyltransferase [Chloroflexota bacterium]|nr:glucose-1-phosphate cytidylyltransferase [Chloroflexota bacterium]